mgnify:CR=1 FL=1
MYLSRIHLINFRPFSDIAFNLQETTLITGRNGSGKTSVLEAIHVLLKSRSFRTSSINSLINREKENFILNAKLEGDLLIFEKKRRNLATNNGYKTEDYKFKNFPILINNFSLAFLESDKEIRRKFLDYFMFHVKHDYADNLKKFKKTLSTRNIALKKNNEEEINIWTKLLVEHAEKITKDREEIFNTITHAIGTLLSIAALVILTVLSAVHGGARMITASTIYGSTLIILYLASTLYHVIKKPSLKAKAKILDHASIFLLIAGTYTPFTLVTLQGGWGWSLFGCTWGIAIFGIAFKIFFTGKYEKLSLFLYLLMGWLIIIAIHPLVQKLPTPGLYLLVCGGVFYTVGTIFYIKDETYKYAHSIWHLFVLAGSICHFFSILGYVTLAN